MFDTNSIIKLLHLVAATVWMGGMTFMLVALRPAALQVLEPQVRARLMVVVWRRFFNLVLGAVAVLLLTGGHLYTSAIRAVKAATGAGNLPLGWHLMAALGVAMVLIFGHIYFAGFRQFQRALAASDGALAAKAAAQINRLVMINFALGWLAIVAVRLVR